MQVMNVLMVLFVAYGVAESAITCIQSAGAEGTVCAGDVAVATQCKRPKWEDYVGLTDESYGCAPCTADANCEKCTPTDDNTACNTPEETGTDFQCHNWEVVDSEWKANAALTTCKALKATATMCNAPDRDTVDASESPVKYTIKMAGCGPCDPTEKTGGFCLECTSDQCNSSPAVAVSFVLAALSALMFSM